MPLLLFTSKNIASRNIAMALMKKGFENECDTLPGLMPWASGSSAEGRKPCGTGLSKVLGSLPPRSENLGFREPWECENVWAMNGVRLIDTKTESVLDVPTNFDTDYLIVLSTHKSKNADKMLTAHFPGNWGNAGMGGQPRTLNIACANRMKILVNELAACGKTVGWPVFMETDHHGPTCNVPIMFVEIGSSEEQWKDEDAVNAVADAVLRSLEKNQEQKQNKTFEAVVGIGGGHYSREFTSLVLESELAVGHIAPKYVIDSLDTEMLMQAITKNVEPVSKIMISKDGTNSTQKKKIEQMANELGIESEIR